jgi:hypothetical protein
MYKVIKKLVDDQIDLTNLVTFILVLTLHGAIDRV